MLSFRVLLPQIIMRIVGVKETILSLVTIRPLLRVSFLQPSILAALCLAKALSIYSGYDTTYLIASDGKTYAWGNDAYGMIGNDSNLTSLNYPAAISTTNLGTKTIASITAGFYYGCALTNDSSVYCWGRNNYAQLGESTLLDQSIPVATNISSVTAGNYLSSISATDFGLTTCSLATDTQTYCWGGGITSNGVFDPDFYATKTNTNILTPIIQSGNKVY